MEKKPKNGIAALLQIAGKRRNHLILSGILAVLHAGLALVPYILVYYIMEGLLNPPIPTDQILVWLGWAAVAAVGSYTFLYASGMASHIAAFNILYELRQQIASKLGVLSLGFIGGYSSGVLKKIMVDDIERIETFIAHQIPDFVKGFTLPIVTLTYLFYVDWRLAAISGVPLLVLAIWMPLVFGSSYTKEMMKHHHKAQEDMNSGIVEFVRAMPVMKIFGQNAERFEKYSGTVNDFATRSSEWLRKSAPPFAVFMSFMSNASLPILIMGTYLYLNQGLSASTLILFLILGVGYLKPMFALSNMGNEISIINRGVQRMNEILEQPVLPASLPNPSFTDFSVTFDRVRFGYTEAVPVLEDISFKLPACSLTAFVGPSGAGKSTAAQLIARFWDPQEGQIRIGQHALETIPPDDLMKHVSFVFQDSFLFEETLYENIRMGMDRTEEQVVAAAQAAQCHSFICELPHGYQTRFGSAGVHLSGGEQQRIQLARAILKDAPILILDEATAFSDPENEYLIQQAFGALIQDKTVVVIAHRLSTITDSDQIIVFDQGKVESKGTHEELLEQSPVYQTLWQAHTRAQSYTL